MKNTRPDHSSDLDPVTVSDNEDPNTADSVEDIVEDLTQQDVLPSVTGSMEEPEDAIAGGIDETGRWDEPIGERGHRAQRHALDDETSYAEKLVSDGLDEADEELRELDEDEEEKEEEEENSGLEK
jgi:hypothetical protein